MEDKQSIPLTAEEKNKDEPSLINLVRASVWPKPDDKTGQKPKAPVAEKK